MLCYDNTTRHQLLSTPRPPHRCVVLADVAVTCPLIGSQRWVVLAETVVASRSAEEVLSKRHINASRGSLSHRQLFSFVHTQESKSSRNHNCQLLLKTCIITVVVVGGGCDNGGVCSSYRVGVVAEGIFHVGIAEIHREEGEGEQKLGPARK